MIGSPRDINTGDRCDEPGCMAIGGIGGDGYLWLGTAADNHADMVEKKRGYWQKAKQSTSGY